MFDPVLRVGLCSFNWWEPWRIKGEYLTFVLEVADYNGLGWKILGRTQFSTQPWNVRLSSSRLDRCAQASPNCLETKTLFSKCHPAALAVFCHHQNWQVVLASGLFGFLSFFLRLLLREWGCDLVCMCFWVCMCKITLNLPMNIENSTIHTSKKWKPPRFHQWMNG